MPSKKLNANEEARKLYKSAPNRNVCLKCGYEFDDETRRYFGECPACGQCTLPISSGGRVSEAEKHDRTYNGGEFGRGEW